jgi:sulfoxide reductase catalytic subunit YedY
VDGGVGSGGGAVLIRRAAKWRECDVTPKQVYLSRRRLLWLAALPLEGVAGEKLTPARRSPFSTEERPTPYTIVTGHTNFYEFGVGKEEPARNAGDFQLPPWTVTVEGAVARRRVFDWDTLKKLAPLEERIYRLRCVEGWSVVVPWIGYPLRALIEAVQPLSKARYVAFESYYDARRMPHSRTAGIPFPYREGLRLDEALHPLTLLCFGLYGESLPIQNGAPVRLIVPWKYGFKSIKSVARIRFTEGRPRTTWSSASPEEYGFYANVNPAVDHPRWRQNQERRLGEPGLRQTLLFNGYPQAAPLYAGMDLRKDY